MEKTWSFSQLHITIQCCGVGLLVTQIAIIILTGRVKFLEFTLVEYLLT